MLRTLNTDGALMSYQSFLEKGSTLHNIRKNHTYTSAPDKGTKQSARARSEERDEQASKLTSFSSHPSFPSRSSCSCQQPWSPPRWCLRSRAGEYIGEGRRRRTGVVAVGGWSVVWGSQEERPRLVAVRVTLQYIYPAGLVGPCRSKLRRACSPVYLTP
jgi:hypothetical protein